MRLKEKLQFPECLELASAWKRAKSRPLTPATGRTVKCSSPIGGLPERSIAEFSPPSLLAACRFSARYQDGGRGSRWQVPGHSQQKQRPLGAAHLCDQVREAGGRVRGQGSGQRLHLRLAGRRASWAPPCRPSPPLPSWPLPSPSQGPHGPPRVRGPG